MCVRVHVCVKKTVHKINGILLLLYAQDSCAHKLGCLHSICARNRERLDSEEKSIMCHLHTYTNPLNHDES